MLQEEKIVHFQDYFVLDLLNNFLMFQNLIFLDYYLKKNLIINILNVLMKNCVTKMQFLPLVGNVFLRKIRMQTHF